MDVVIFPLIPSLELFFCSSILAMISTPTFRNGDELVSMGPGLCVLWAWCVFMADSSVQYY